MSSIRVRLCHLTTKKVPALSLVFVAIVGMALGVFAATITVATTQTYNGGEQGLIHSTGSVLTFADNGLSVISNALTGNASSSFLTSANKNAYANNMVSGHWAEAILITDTSGDTATHTLTITLSQGTTAPEGTAFSFSPVNYSVTGVTGSTTPTITLFIDLGSSSVTTPLSIYIKST